MKKYSVLLCVLLSCLPLSLMAQDRPLDTEYWFLSPGVLGTVFLTVVVILVGAIIVIFRLNAYLRNSRRGLEAEKKRILIQDLISLEEGEIDEVLAKRKASSKYELAGSELGSEEEVMDERGLVQKIRGSIHGPFFEEKRSSNLSIETSESLQKIVIWYLGAAIVWLLFGTFIGQYLGMKFVWPELDHVSWLSFGRLRPVHTNTVFWGWASLAMIGLGYFVVSRTSNTDIYSTKYAWLAWRLINAAVILGNLSLMLGINNGGGEYREYIWPVMLLFAGGLVLTFYNFYKTVLRRKLSEIYISNWFILAALLWTIILTIIGYLPFYQDGLGETVIQGYYMHQGVGMWFMTFTLGLVYYFLPSSLNKPIYSYSLGVLAFWTQMLFYTLIGTHHFVFSPLPWWLQTVAIIFSAGMFIPVIAGTTNFYMTMRGSWNQIAHSYVLPFFLVGVVFYFVGSTQGSFQAFRFTNYLWHFTDFNVAHSHMTMYGIICFFLWAGIYTLIPKLTGKEPPQVWVGAHFWMAFIGLIAYMMSMMVGGTLKGLSWIEQHPFIESVILMKPFWVWRAIGGSLMFTSHIVFAFNFFYMVSKEKPISVSEQPFQKILA